MSTYSPMQIWQLKNFGKEEYFKTNDNTHVTECVNVGPMGVGKTYIIMEAFGLYLMKLREQGYKNLNYVLIGKTYNSIKRNMLNVLSRLFGNDFKYDHSVKNGITCDARLFNFPIFFIPLNDVNAESRIRGLSDITGAIIDEHTLIPEEQYTLILARIRGGQKLPYPYANNWLISSTNPDAPSHWLLKNYIKKGLIKQIQWYCRDANWNGFKEYIAKIKRQYKHIPAFYQRYVLGRWMAAEGLVFSAFDESRHVIEGSIDFRLMKRAYISCDYGSNHKTSIQVHYVTYQDKRICAEDYEFTRTAVSTIAAKVSELADKIIKQLGLDPDILSYDEYADFNGKAKRLNVYVDPAAQTLVDELRKIGLYAYNAKNKHIDGILYVNQEFELDNLYILRNEGTEKLIDEIYSYKFNDADKAKDGDVIKINDDHCDAFRYGVFSDHKYNE